MPRKFALGAGLGWVVHAEELVAVAKCAALCCAPGYGEDTGFVCVYRVVAHNTRQGIGDSW